MTNEQYKNWQALQGQFAGGFDYSTGAVEPGAPASDAAAIAAAQKAQAEQDAEVWRIWRKNPGEWTATERALVRGQIAGASRG